MRKQVNNIIDVKTNKKRQKRKNMTKKETKTFKDLEKRDWY